MVEASRTPRDEEIIARYRARYRKQDRFFASLNMLLGLFIKSERTKPPAEPRRILIANAGHLGDIVISTTLFPILRAAYPQASFDFLTNSSARAAIEGHPFLGRVLLLDHWRSSRADCSLLRKVARYYAQIPTFVRSLRKAQYDIAIDLHAWHPNYILLYWLAGIPIRAGFGRVGYEPMLTHKTPFVYDRRHELDLQLDVLRTLGIDEKTFTLGKPSLPPITESARLKARERIGNKRYAVLHPTASTPTRSWTIEGWSELAHRLIAGGLLPVVTGTGPRDEDTANAIAAKAPGILNLVGKVSWGELAAILEGAETVFAVETAIGHLARALNRPVVALYGGMADSAHWAPIGAQVATHTCSCAPCFNKRGCQNRDCLTNLKVEEIENLASIHLEPR